MLVRTSNGEYDFIDYRETAPSASTEDMYVKNGTLSQVTGLAVGVPWVYLYAISSFMNGVLIYHYSGEIRGYELAHSKQV